MESPRGLVWRSCTTPHTGPPMHYVIDEGHLSRPWRYAALFTKAYLRVFGDTVDPSESGVRPLSHEPVFDAFAPRRPLFLLPSLLLSFFFCCRVCLPHAALRSFCLRGMRGRCGVCASHSLSSISATRLTGTAARRSYAEIYLHFGFEVTLWGPSCL